MSLQDELDKLVIDDRDAEQIFNEARLRIPRYAPGWTDFNDSDPGITLLQLFSWLTEQMFYRMNRVPQRTYLKFLQMLNLTPKPPQPAEAYLTLIPKEPGANAPLSAGVPRGARFAAQSDAAPAPVIFETETGIDLVRMPLSAVQVYDAASGGFSNMTESNMPDDKTAFRPFGAAAQDGSALYLGFKAPAKNAAPFKGRIFPQQFQLRVFKPIVSAASSEATDTDMPASVPASALVWEYKPDDASRWQRLDADDHTDGFRREGFFAIRGPAEIAPLAALGTVKEPHFWLRCRVQGNPYPRGRAPIIDFIRPNVVKVVSLQTVRDEILPDADGLPGLRASLRNGNIHPESVRLQVNFPGAADLDWKRVRDIRQSRNPDAQIFELDAISGELLFPDGKNGRIPPAGAQITTLEYRHGGGKAANVDAGAINAPLVNLTAVDRVSNERKANGGTDEQRIDELIAGAPSALRGEYIVSERDFSARALRIGGVAKAAAYALMNPRHPGVEVPGSITVVIAPDSDERPPRVSPELRELVSAQLNASRPLTAELYVQYAKYRAITVEADVHVDPRASFELVKQDVQQRLRAYLDRLPIGADVHPAKLTQAMLAAAEVKTVDLKAVNRDEQSAPAVVKIARDELAYPGEHIIEIRAYTDL